MEQSDLGAIFSQKNSSRLAKKWLSYGKQRMPIYGIIGILRAILAHNLVKYQYFTYSVQVSALNVLKCGFHDQKTTKLHLSQFAIFRKCLLQKRLIFTRNNIFS